MQRHLRAPLNIKVWLAFLPALFLPLMAVIIYGVATPNDQEQSSRWAYGLIKGFLFLWPILALLTLIHPRSGTASDHPKRRTSIWVGTVLGAVIAGLIAGLMQIPALGDLVMSGAENVIRFMTKMGMDKNFFVTALLMSIIHSALEEYYWRWFCYGQLARFVPNQWAHIIAAIGFSLHHYVLVWIYFTPPLAIFLGSMVAVGGWLWSQLYQRTGSLVGPWISHMIVDFAIFWIGYQMMTA